MSADMAAMERKMENLRREVANQFDGVRADIKDLTKALRDLIRLDGEIRSVAEMVQRNTAALDDHEKRLRSVEQVSLTTRVKTSAGERLFWIVATAAGSGITGIVVYMVTRA